MHYQIFQLGAPLGPSNPSQSRTTSGTGHVFPIDVPRQEKKQDIVTVKQDMVTFTQDDAAVPEKFNNTI